MKHYLQAGVYVSSFRELVAVVDEEEKRILEAQDPSTEDDAFMLLEWASDTMKEIRQIQRKRIGGDRLQLPSHHKFRKR